MSQEQIRMVSLTPEYSSKKVALSNLIDGKGKMDAKLAALIALAEESENSPMNANDFTEAVLERYVKVKDAELYEAYQKSLENLLAA